jgi:nitroreductase
MELKKAILERRSIRAFSEKPVEKNLLKELLTAGIYAPTAGNIQPWIFFSITDPDGINKIRTISPGMLSNPKALICVCSDQKKAFERAGKGGKTLSLMDCAMAAQNIMLRAYDLGLGSCVIRSFNPSALREIVGAPDHIQPELIVTIGYPAENPDPPARNTDVIYREEYGKKEEGK